MRSHLLITLLLAFASVSQAQDRHNWDSLAQLKPGDRVRVSFTGRSPVTGGFQGFTPEQVTVATVSANKAEVAKVERYRPGGWNRGETAAVGAAIGFAGGFAIGFAVSGCKSSPSAGLGSVGCIGLSRGEASAIVGGVGAVAGALIGAALPHHHRELIYSAK